MARPRKNAAETTAPPPPQDPRKVKNGCCSCTHYKLEMKAFPCRDCKDWNYWSDKSNPTADPSNTPHQEEPS